MIGAAVHTHPGASTGAEGPVTPVAVAPHGVPMGETRELTTGPFLTAEAVARGQITQRQLQGRSWSSPARGVAVHASVPDSRALRLRVAQLVMPPGAGVSGSWAAHALGVQVLPQRARQVQITAPRDVPLRKRPGIDARHALLPPSDLTKIDGITVTNPLRTAFDLARRPDLATGLVAIDGLLHKELITADALAAYSLEHPGWRGVRHVEQVLALAEPKTESPMETRTRLVLVQGGLPRPEAQIEVRDDHGWLIGRTDLGYREVKLGIEYDGSPHFTEQARERDRLRQNALVAAGWTLLRYRAADIYLRPHLVVRQVRAHLLAAGWPLAA